MIKLKKMLRHLPYGCDGIGGYDLEYRRCGDCQYQSQCKKIKKRMFLVVPVIAILAIVTFTSMFIDPLHYGYIDSFILYDSFGNKLYLSEIISDSQKYKGNAFDFSEYIRSQDIKFTGDIEILEVNLSEDGFYQIITDIVVASTGQKFSIWMDKGAVLGKLKLGDKVKISAELNGVNNNWIILNKGVIIYD